MLPLVVQAPLGTSAAAQLGAEADTPPPQRMAAGDLVKVVTERMPLTLRRVEVDGDVDLQGVGIVQALFRCQECRFNGSISASDVEFGKSVDLAGSRILGETDFRGALFKDRMRADGAAFGGNVRLAWARFGGDASFRDTDFSKQTDFHGTQFAGRADFSEVTFGQRSNFSNVQLNRGADFQFSTWMKDAEVYGIGSADLLNFAGGTFHHFLNLKRGRITGALDLRGSDFRGPAKLYVDELSVEDLFMDVGTAGKIDGGPSALLRRLETSAKARGDLEVANEARYALLSFDARDNAGFSRWWDRYVYRNVAGYLVRPMHPLRALAILMGFAAVWRAFFNTRKERRRHAFPATADNPAGARPEHSGEQRVSMVVSRGALIIVNVIAELVQGIAETFGTAFRLRFGDQPAQENIEHYQKEVDSSTEELAERTQEVQEREQEVQDRTHELSRLASESQKGQEAILTRAFGRWIAALNRRRAAFLRWTRALHVWRSAVTELTLSGGERQLFMEQAQDLTARTKAGVRWAEFIVYKVLIAVFIISLGNANPTIRQLIDAVRL